MQQTVTDFSTSCGCSMCSRNDAFQEGQSAPSAEASTTVTDERALLRYLETPSFRWNATQDLETPVIVTYSFLETNELPAKADLSYSPTSVTSYSASERVNFRLALDEFEKVSGVKFVEVDGEGTAMIQTYNAPGSVGVAGYAYYPGSSTYYTSTSDLVMDVSSAWTPGSSGFLVAMHEIGHAMGLSHPFNNSSGDKTYVLDPTLDNLQNTVMTYNNSGPKPSALQNLDIAALQHMYGASYDTDGLTFNWNSGIQRLTITGDAGADLVIAPKGDNVVRVWGGHDTVVGRNEDDTILGGNGWDWLSGAAGNDLIDGGNGSDRIWGDEGNDTLRGGVGNDSLYGGAFSDRLSGDAGNDKLYGGSSNDFLSGGTGNDLLSGESGRDTLNGGDGDDTLMGGTGSDSLFGGNGMDRLSGGDGNDTVIGGNGNDFIQGGDGYDQLKGGYGNDTLLGGADFDRLEGSFGNDMLRGGDGSGVLTGGDGQDTLYGGSGNDDYYGGSGVDQFHFHGGTDDMFDWQDGEGLFLRLSEAGLAPLTIQDLRDGADVYGNAIRLYLSDSGGTKGDALTFWSSGLTLDSILDDITIL